VGWLWFLGMLVPTIELVQVGSQALADRYMYLPLAGLAIALAWGAADLVGTPGRRARAGGRRCWSSPLLAGVTRAQLATWHDSVSLFSHARGHRGEPSRTRSWARPGPARRAAETVRTIARRYGSARLPDRGEQPGLAARDRCETRYAIRRWR
jgi:hypothetical protein